MEILSENLYLSIKHHVQHKHLTFQKLDKIVLSSSAFKINKCDVLLYVIMSNRKNNLLANADVLKFNNVCCIRKRFCLAFR